MVYTSVTHHRVYPSLLTLGIHTWYTPWVYTPGTHPVYTTVLTVVPPWVYTTVLTFVPPWVYTHHCTPWVYILPLYTLGIHLLHTREGERLSEPPFNVPERLERLSGVSFLPLFLVRRLSGASLPVYPGLGGSREPLCVYASLYTLVGSLPAVYTSQRV